MLRSDRLHSLIAEKFTDKRESKFGLRHQWTSVFKTRQATRLFQFAKRLDYGGHPAVGAGARAVVGD